MYLNIENTLSYNNSFKPKYSIKSNSLGDDLLILRVIFF